MAGRQSHHAPCNAVQTITHALTPHVALQSHPQQPATNKNATNADAVAQWLQRVRRKQNFQTMNAGAVVEEKRGDDGFMNGLPAALLRLFQSTRKQLEDFFRSRYPFRFLQNCRHCGSCGPESVAVGCRRAAMRHSRLQAALSARSGCNRVCSHACEGHCFSTPFLL